jgi:uncharacterized BrkB/YihY/UPF0761 family membrane protein
MNSAAPKVQPIAHVDVSWASGLKTIHGISLHELMQEAYEVDSSKMGARVSFYWIVTLLPFFILGLGAMVIVYLLSN